MAFKRKTPTQKKIQKVDAVLCSDLHIRADVPLCRTDDYTKAMWDKLSFIFNLCSKYNVPLFCGGDIGHRSQWPNWLLSEFISLARGVTIYSCLGQHDLPGHSIDEVLKSGCGVLHISNIVGFDSNVLVTQDKIKKIVVMSHYGEERPTCIGIDLNIKDSFPVMLTHRLVTNNLKEDWPGQVSYDAVKLLKDFPQYNLILSGDNHKPFVAEYEGRVLVNPGSMMRNTVDQIDHRPRVYLWDALQNIVEPVYLPIEDGVIDSSHIEVKKDRDERMKEMTEGMKVNYEIEMDYEKNMEIHLNQNKVEDQIEQKIWLSIERGKNAGK